MSEPEAESPPMLRVVRGGEPSDEELAVLTAVLTARSAAADDEAGGDPLRRPLSPWVSSGLVKGTRTKA